LKSDNEKWKGMEETMNYINKGRLRERMREKSTPQFERDE
jgi:hypothetical protein